MTELSYDEIQAKTVAWCKNLLDSGIYSLEDYNKCMGSFTKDLDGTVSDSFDVPRTGIEYNFGMYNRDKEYLEDASPSGYKPTVMLTSSDGKYLGAHENGTLYHITSYNKEGLNQKELEWSIISHGDSKFSIMSIAYQKYINSDSDDKVICNSDNMNPSSIWKFTQVENKTLIESTVKNNYYLSYNHKNKYCASLDQGISDEKMWNIFNLSQKKGENPVPEFDGVEYKNKQLILFENYVMSKKLKKIIATEILVLQETIGIVRSVFDNIKKYLEQTYEQSRSALNKASAKYLKELGEIDEYRRQLSSPNISGSLFDTYTDTIKQIEKKIGLDGNALLTIENKQLLLKELDIQKKKYIMLLTDEIKRKNKELINLKKISNAEDELDSFIRDLNYEIEKADIVLNNNNKIMSRQASEIHKFKKDTHYKSEKNNMMEDKNEIIDENKKIIDEKYSYKKKVATYYIFGIITLIVILAILSYFFYKNILVAYY